LFPKIVQRIACYCSQRYQAKAQSNKNLLGLDVLCVDVLTDRKFPVLGSGELQYTQFQLFDTFSYLWLICEITDGKGLKPDHNVLD